MMVMWLNVLGCLADKLRTNSNCEGGGTGRLLTEITRYTVTTIMTPALSWAAIRANLMLDYMIVTDNRYTDTTIMTPALRWAALRAILMFH